MTDLRPRRALAGLAAVLASAAVACGDDGEPGLGPPGAPNEAATPDGCVDLDDLAAGIVDPLDIDPEALDPACFGDLGGSGLGDPGDSGDLDDPFGAIGEPLSDSMYDITDAPCSTFSHGSYAALVPGDYEVSQDRGERADGLGYDSMICELVPEDTYLHWYVLVLFYDLYDSPGAAYTEWEHDVNPQRISDAEPYADHPVEGRPWTHAGVDQHRGVGDGEDTSRIIVLDGNLILRAELRHRGDVPENTAVSLIDQAAAESMAVLPRRGA